MATQSQSNEHQLVFREILPKTGLLYDENITEMTFCKPKILPLKSFTVEKLEKIQKEAAEKLKVQEAAQKSNTDPTS